LDKPRIDKSWYERPEGMSSHVCGGGIVVRVGEGGPFLALIGQHGSPLLELPKGKVDPDESVEEAATREIAEESGIGNLRLIKALGVRERLNFARTAWKVTHYFLFTTTQIEASPSDTRHFMQWVPLEDCPSLYWPEQDELVRAAAPEIRALSASL